MPPVRRPIQSKPVNVAVGSGSVTTDGDVNGVRPSPGAATTADADTSDSIELRCSPTLRRQRTGALRQLRQLVPGFGGALVELYPRITVALLSHCPPNPLPITWLVCGFDMALSGFARLFCILHSRSSWGKRLPDRLSRRGGIDTGAFAWEYPIVKSATLDDRRRLVMPPECPPGSAVTIQELDQTTWLVKRQVPSREYKIVMIPIINRLPDDPEWGKVEQAFTRHASKNLPEPEE